VLNLLTVLLTFGLSMAQTPAPAARDGVITGQVVDASTGKPVGAAIVSIAGAGTAIPGGLGEGFREESRIPRILTGSDGRFGFRDLPAGRFTVLVTKGGYADGASGRRVFGGASQPVVLTATVRTAETSVRMWKYAAIAGTIVDESGEPVVALQVTSARRTFVAGRRRFVPIGPSARTDDRGVYRLSGLLPGEYLVTTSQPSFSANTSFDAGARAGRGAGSGLSPGSADAIQLGGAQFMIGRGGAIPPPPVGDRMQIYPTVFYPSALSPEQATTITLVSGEERLGVDLQLQPVPAVRVGGTVTGGAGPGGMLPLKLMPAGVDDISAEALAPESIADASGAFTFAAVPAGRYTLRASSAVAPPGSTRPGEMQWLAMPIVVGGDDIDGLVAVMRPALRITARLEFEGATPRPPAQAQRAGQFTPPPFRLESDDLASSIVGGIGRMVGGAGEQVTLGGFAAGTYRVRVAASPPGWMFKAAMLNGVDVSETPFEFTRDIPDLVLTYTDRWSGMSGVVQGAGAAGAMVLAFTTNPQSWDNTGANPRRLKSTRANAKGEFGLSSVPPGEYYVIAVAEDQGPEWRDPKTLEGLARIATQVSIAEGEHKTIDLRLKEVRQ
jgi:hypothetical protein